MTVAALLAIQQALQQTAYQAPADVDGSSTQQQAVGPRRRKAAQQHAISGSKSGGSAESSTNRRQLDSSIRLHVVAVLSSYSVRRAAQVFLGSMLVRNFSYEIMVLDEYAGAMLLQVSPAQNSSASN
jgi:hypothetical protein